MGFGPFVGTQGGEVGAAGQDLSINIWETRTFDIVTSLQGHNHQIFKVTVSPHGHTIASSSSGGDIRIWKSR
ncbi:MAG: hypothetical protein R3C49_11325 [Planctomycetaceae bacterium]